MGSRVILHPIDIHFIKKKKKKNSNNNFCVPKKEINRNFLFLGELFSHVANLAIVMGMKDSWPIILLNPFL